MVAAVRDAIFPRFGRRFAHSAPVSSFDCPVRALFRPTLHPTPTMTLAFGFFHSCCFRSEDRLGAICCFPLSSWVFCDCLCRFGIWHAPPLFLRFALLVSFDFFYARFDSTTHGKLQPCLASFW